MRARKFASEITGGPGNVMLQNLSIEELEKRLMQAGITDTKKFLEKVTTDSQGVIHLFPWSGLLNEKSELSDTFRVPCLKEKRMTAKDLDVRIMIDAEQTYFQPAISRLTLELMQKYNKEKAIVFNTYQCYLKEALNEVKTDLNQAQRQKFYFGAKLVRGAYMEQERARAVSLNYTDPINPSYEATTEMYHNTLAECLKRVKELKNAGDIANKIGIMVASHNEDTVRFAIQKYVVELIV
ncbi:hydroxyproline dehydrogenase [Sarracenia purpurea var. burkii]